MNMSADQKTLQSAPTDTCRTSEGRGREGGWGGDGQDTATKVMEGKPQSFKITTRGKTGHV